MKKAILVISLLLLFLVSTNANNPVIEITCAADLVALSEASLSTDGTSSNPRITYYEGATYRLTQDIDMKGIEWTPIKEYRNQNSVRFKATFDGNHKSISNININKPNTRYIAFIAMLDEKGVVKDLTISGNIVGKSAVSGIVGLSSGVVSNCVNKATIQGSENEIAGIVAYNTGIIEKCKNYGKLVVGNATRIGGITATLIGGNAYIKECENHADILCARNSSSVGGIAGSVVGQNCEIDNNSITACSNYGKIVVERTEEEIEQKRLFGGSNQVGGIIAQAKDCKIVDCHNHGEIESVMIGVDTRGTYSGGYRYTGGIVGDGSRLIISDCSNNAHIIGSIAGGIAGKATDVQVINTSNSGNISAYQSKDEAGGILTLKGKNNVVTNSTSTGDITTRVVPNYVKEFIAAIQAAANELYPINNKEDLIALRESLHLGGETVGNSKIRYKEGATYQLTTDIDLGNMEWNPIGKYDYEFNAVFDGNNKQIKGLRITKPHEHEVYGLFGCASEQAVIKNLAVSGTIEIESGTIGSVIALSYGLVENCSSTVKFICGGGIGGIVGNCVEYGKVIDCTFDGSFTIVGDRADIGGIVGATRASTIVSGCINRANIVASLDNSNVGGIVGRATKDSVALCQNYGHILVTTKESEQTELETCVGGIVGLSDHGVVYKCYNEGNMESDDSFMGCVGGIVGYVSNSRTSHHINKGDATGHKAGGIVGYASYGKIANCSNMGGTIKSFVKIGGNAGGIIGTSVDYSIVMNCYNEGLFISVDDACRAGGIGGYIGGNQEVINCISVTKVEPNYMFMGAIVGLAAAQNQMSFCASNCYYLKEDATNDKVAPYGVGGLNSDFRSVYKTNTGCMAKTTDELKGAALLTNLNSKAVELNIAEKKQKSYRFELCKWVVGENGFPKLDIESVAK